MHAGESLELSAKTTPLRSDQAIYIALAGTMVMAAAVGIGRFAYTPLLPPMQEAFSWSVAQAGDVASANFLGYMLGALLASVLAQRPERQHWLLSGMLLIIITTCGGGFITSFSAWLGIRFLSGIASAFCLVLSTALVMEFLATQARSQLGAWHFAGVGIGIVISVFAIEFVRIAGFSVSVQWIGLGITTLILLTSAWVIIRLIPEQLAQTQTATATIPPQRITSSRLLKKLIIAYGLFGFGYIVTTTFIVAMVRDLGFASVIEPLTWVVFGLIAAPSVLIWQRLVQRFGMFPTLRLAYAIEAIGILLAGFGSSYAALIIGGALLGGTFMGITALGLIAARQLATDNPGRTIGWMTASFGFGQLLGPAVAGRLAQITQGFAMPSLLAALLLLAGIALLHRAERS